MSATGSGECIQDVIKGESILMDEQKLNRIIGNKLFIESIRRVTAIVTNFGSIRLKFEGLSFINSSPDQINTNLRTHLNEILTHLCEETFPKVISMTISTRKFP